MIKEFSRRGKKQGELWMKETLEQIDAIGLSKSEKDDPGGKPPQAD